MPSVHELFGDDLSGVSPFHEALRRNTWSTLDQLRAEAPIVWSKQLGGHWAIFDYELIRSVLLDAERFSSAKGVAVPHDPEQPPSLPLMADGAEHDEWRRILSPVFTRSAVDARRTEIRGRVARHAERVPERFDAVSDIIWPLTAELWLDVVLGASALVTPAVLSSVQTLLAKPDAESYRAATYDLQTWLERDYLGGCDTQVTSQLSAWRCDGRRLRDEEKVSCLMMILGGLETNCYALGNQILATLTTAPEDQRIERRTFLEEVLRLRSPILCFGRTATTDVALGPFEIRADSQVLLYWSAANRDPLVFGTPPSTQPQHLSFGAGPHYCIAAHFARVVAEEFDSVLNAELAGCSLDIADEPSYFHGFARGPTRISVLR